MRVEVCYADLSDREPDHLPASGYAYDVPPDLELAIGDLVEVPATWLDETRGDYGPKVATVLRLDSEYIGAASMILRRREPALA